MTQTQTKKTVAQNSNTNVSSLTEVAKRAALDLVSAASCRDADRVAVDIRVEEKGPVIVVEDDGVGMSPSQLEMFFDTSQEDDDFYGADEVHVSTTREGHTLKAHSENPPEYRVSEMDAARWEQGTRVEIVNFDGSHELTKHLDEDELREYLALDDSDWTALLNVHVDDHAHTIRRLGDEA